MQTYASWWNTSTHSYSKRFKIQSLRSTLRRRQQILTRSVTRNSVKTTSIPSSRSGHTQRRTPDIKHLSFRNRFQRCTESCPPRANHLPATSSSSTTSACRDSRRVQDTWQLSRVASWLVSSRHCMLLLVLGSRCREQKTRVWYPSTTSCVPLNRNTSSAPLRVVFHRVETRQSPGSISRWRELLLLDRCEWRCPRMQTRVSPGSLLSRTQHDDVQSSRVRQQRETGETDANNVRSILKRLWIDPSQHVWRIWNEDHVYVWVALRSQSTRSTAVSDAINK